MGHKMESARKKKRSEVQSEKKKPSKGSERKRKKSFLSKLRPVEDPGDPNGRYYRTPDMFAEAIVKDMDLLLNGGVAINTLKKGRIITENGHAFYCNSEGEVSGQIHSSNAYQVITYFRKVRESRPDLWAAPTAQGLLDFWESIFKDGKGDHVRHLCSATKKGVQCVLHTCIGTRVLNEEDKHWAYFLYHPNANIAAKFRDLCQTDEDFGREVQNHVELETDINLN